MGMSGVQTDLEKLHRTAMETRWAGLWNIWSSKKYAVCILSVINVTDTFCSVLPWVNFVLYKFIAVLFDYWHWILHSCICWSVLQCDVVMNLSASQRCEFVKNTPDCTSDEGFIKYPVVTFCLFPSNLLPLAITLYVRTHLAQSPNSGFTFYIPVNWVLWKFICGVWHVSVYISN